ncbi:MAG TPA: response regulator [Blastocatellia bacterium]|nr:response regulator [Blastocatellia bacterium]
MEPENRQLLPSGIEPVDKLLGGLKTGLLYLVHGEAAGKSLFGIKFLIEGLKRGESTALVIRYSPEDAVRRFARLGYDCLDDIYSGRLVILEYSDDIIQQVARLQSITPVLRELEWLIGESRPRRLVLDPVTSLVVGEHGDINPRVEEFANWALSFGATVILVANGDNQEVIKSFKPLVEESFRFEVVEAAERASRLMAFEKSDQISPQAIEVDPSRGVFLLGRPQKQEAERPLRSFKMPEFPRLDAQPETGEKPADLALDIDLLSEAEPVEPPADRLEAEPEEAERERTEAEQADTLSALLDDLAGEPFPLNLNVNELGPSHGQASATPPDDQAHLAFESGKPGTPSPQAPTPDEPRARPVEKSGEAGVPLDQTIAARAMEILLRPAEFESDSSALDQAGFADTAHAAPQAKAAASAAIDPKTFNVLVINDDQSECEFIAQALGEYTVESVQDGVSGLAKLISFKPDLVILDVDLPIIDGFKVLAHIRSSLNMPIIIVSGSRVRASDRMLSAELGADYYLTKPYSIKELRQKARQLIARYHGINSWIVTAPGDSRASREQAAHLRISPAQQAAGPASTHSHNFVSYSEFAAQVEKRIYITLDKGPAFSVVGCRLPDMTANAGRNAIRLYEMVQTLVRESDIVSTNPRNDLVVLLVDADTAGARAFIARLRSRVKEEMGQNLLVWMRSFPELEEASDASRAADSHTQLKRRASDKRAGGNNHPAQDSSEPGPDLFNSQ